MTTESVVQITESEASVSPAPARPEQIIVSLKPDAPPFDGDILVVLAPSNVKLKYGTRMSVRPQPEKCVCKGRGWGVVEEDDGSRFHRRVPGLCKCIAQAVARVCGTGVVIAAWAPPEGDPVLAEWRTELVTREAEAEAALVAIRAEREKVTCEAEAEADKVEAEATAAEPAAADAARELGAARDAVATAVSTVEQARVVLKDAEKMLARARVALARVALATAEAAHVVAAHAVDRTGAAQLRATAAILRGPKSAWADKERRALAALERVRREMGVVAGLGMVGTMAAQASAPVLAESCVFTKDSAP